MFKPYETHKLDWRGIGIEVRYCPSWSKSYEEIYATGMAHLEIRSLDNPISPLPMTETGYRSHFSPAHLIEEVGGALAFVEAWLEDEARSPQWKAKEEAARQPSLF